MKISGFIRSLELKRSFTSMLDDIPLNSAPGHYKARHIKGRKLSLPGALMTLLALLLSPSFLSSCSDDLGAVPGTDGGDDTTLTIYLPDVAAAAEYGATRADSYRNTRAKEESNEATINNLWFYAFPQGSTPASNKKAEKIDLTSSSHNFGTSGAYVAHPVKGFKDGSYHIYMLANIEDYVKLPSTSTDVAAYLSGLNEDGLKALVADFSAKYIEEANLPMYCLNTDVSGAGYNDGTFTFSKTQKTLYADLTFLCAKVRYTILFDKTDNINNFFPTNDVDFLSASADNVRQQTIISGTSPAGFIPDGLSGLTLSKVTYPAPGSEYLKANPAVYESDLAPKADSYEWTETDDQRAWQGIVYLPENKLTGSDRSKLSFAATGDAVKDNYDLVLFNYDASASQDNSMVLERGKFYDAIVKLQNPETVNFDANLSVHAWSAQNLSYQLHGPYELIVETTTIAVETGKTTVFWYQSDVAPEDIHFSYPTLGDKEIFIAEIYKDDEGNYILNDDGKYQIAVRINPAISYSEYDQLKDVDGEVKAEYKYFSIIAGDLHKKINIDPLHLYAFLTVTPQTVTIDVREYLSSGLDSHQIQIEYETNITGENISISDPSGIIAGLGSGALKISETETGQLTGSGTSYSTGGDQFNIGILNLDIKGLMSGNTFWQTQKSYKVTFSIEGVDEPQTLIIEVKPYTTDYIIHFKYVDVADLWESPHIYVYQCLEVPADATDCFYIGTKTSYAGKTVGYRQLENGSWDPSYAALEYCFSNDFGFKGWEGYGGEISYQVANPYAWSGFVILGDGNQNTDEYNYGTAFSPSNYTNGYYNYEMNLNAGHLIDKDSWLQDICSDCYAGRYKAQQPNRDFRSWPGIAMQPEYDEYGNKTGWWKYTLSGVATPGKAMIMFADHHLASEDRDLTRRYPAHSQVGVPLFDYPSHEGWFLYDKNKDVQGFQNTEPESIPLRFTPDDTIIVKWENEADYGNRHYPNLYVYDSDAENFKPKDWPGFEVGENTGSRQNTYTLPKLNGSYDQLYLMPNNNDNEKARFMITTSKVQYLEGLPNGLNVNSSIKYDHSTKTYNVVLWSY